MNYYKRGSYSEAMRYATEFEKGRDRELYRREMEQQQYEEELETLKEEILDSFHSFKERNYNKLSESEWDECENNNNNNHTHLFL